MFACVVDAFFLQLLILLVCFVLLCVGYNMSQRSILWLCIFEGLRIVCSYIFILFPIFEEFPAIISSDRCSTSSAHGLLGLISQSHLKILRRCRWSMFFLLYWYLNVVFLQLWPASLMFFIYPACSMLLVLFSIVVFIWLIKLFFYKIYIFSKISILLLNPCY